MMDTRILWERIVASLKSKITDVSYKSWIATSEPVGILDDTLIIMSCGEVAINALRTMYTEPISSLATSISGEKLGVCFILPEERELYEEKCAADLRRTSGMLNPRYTFDNFVIGGSNNFAHAGAKAVADNPALAYNPLFMYGGVGLGKTHLMHAIGNQIKELYPSYKILYVTSETFTNELIQSIQDNTNAQFRNRYRNVDVLMIDDIQFIAGKDRTQEEFFNTFNALHTSGKQIVISSDRPPMEMVTLEERLRTRFEWGLITDIQPPDLETRIAILRKKASAENMEIDENVLAFIAEKVNSNIRQLEGSLTRVIAYSRLTHQKLDLELCDLALRDIVANYNQRKITIEYVQQMVADFYGTDVEGMKSPRRTVDVAIPRQVAMYLARELTDLSHKIIGESFGGRDYSTVISACKKVAADLKKDPELANNIEGLKKRIKGA